MDSKENSFDFLLFIDYMLSVFLFIYKLPSVFGSAAKAVFLTAIIHLGKHFEGGNL